MATASTCNKSNNGTYHVQSHSCSHKYGKLGKFREGSIFAKLRIFRENKILAKCRNHSVVTDIGKSCHSRDFVVSQMCIYTQFANIKFSRKFPDL